MNDARKLEKLILDLVHSDNYQPLKPKAIAKKLRRLDEEREIKRTIKRLIKKGRLVYGPKHLVLRGTNKPEANNNSTTKSARKTSAIVGKFRRASAGFGFVTPQGSIVSDRSDDIFIPKTKTADAADLDIVKVRVSSRRNGNSQRQGSNNRSTGRIVDIIERHTHQFVGTYRETAGYGFVDVDGGVFESGILVGDAGAKNCKVDDKVVIEMVHFPSLTQDGEGVIVEVLGDRGTPGVDTLSVIRQYDLPVEFPENVLDDARDQADKFDESLGQRTDFTNTTVITIDPKTARDFDDAISLKRLENGHWELGVHIADVSHFVPLRSDLDNEAYNRGTSIYLPDRVIPMLPEIISNNLASLQPDRVRYCMTALIEFTAVGVPIGTELHRGAIKSAHRFTYEEIDDYLENDRPWKAKLSAEVFDLVRNMHTLAMKLRRRRMQAGAINLILPEVKIDLDDDGCVSGAHTVDNTESHQVIEEFMLAGNEAVAQKLDDENLDYLRRIHPQPSEQKLTQLTEFVQQLGIQCDSLKSRFEIKRVVEQSEGRPERHAIHYAVLRSMQKAVYSPEAVGHYALNSDNYCHFTSPIRRYPDLIIHRMVGDLIDGKKPDSNFDRLSMLGNHCSDLEKRATDAERELIRLKLLNFMVDRIGMRMQAVITGVEPFGIFAQGIEIPAEGIIPLANLPDDRYQYERGTRTLVGFKKGNEYRLGDEIQVTVAMVDPDQRMLEFEIFGVQPTRENATRRSHASTRSVPTESRSRSKRGSDSKPKTKSLRSGENTAQDSDGHGSGEKFIDDWTLKRASGPQKGQKKKRRTRNSNDKSASKKKKTKRKQKKKKAPAKPRSSSSKSKSKNPGKSKSKSAPKQKRKRK